MLKKIVFSFILIFSFSIDAANNKVGDVDLGEVTHSKAFQFIKDNMLGKWEGTLTQHSGNVIEPHTILNSCRMVTPLEKI